MLHIPSRTFYLLVILLFLSESSFAQRDLSPSPLPSGAVDYEHTRWNMYDTKLTPAQKALLAPLPEDKAAYADFLRQDKTGLFRLHPKGKYEPGITVSAN